MEHGRRRCGRWRRPSSAYRSSLPEPAEYVALGAARQAAWTLSGDPEPPAWEVPATELPEAAPATALRAAYAEVLADADPLLR